VLVRVQELVPGRVQELVPGREPGQEPASVLVLEPGQVPGLEPALELGLGLHRQPSSRLTTMPAGLIIFSFSSKNSFI